MASKKNANIRVDLAALNGELFSLERDDDFILVKFNNKKEIANFFTVENLTEFSDTLDFILTIPDLKGIIFLSEKNKYFLAGYPLDYFSHFSSQADIENAALVLGKLTQKISDIAIPTVSIIKGICLAGGMDFILACKHRVAASDSPTSFAYSEVALGLIPHGGSCYRLPRIIGLEPALDLMLECKFISAEEAYELGLLDVLDKKDELLQAAKELCLKDGQEQIIISSEETGVFQRISDSVAVKSFSKYLYNKAQSIKLNNTPIGKAIIEGKIRRKISKLDKSYAFAASKLLNIVVYSMHMDTHDSFQMEARNFAETVVSKEAKALFYVKYLENRLEEKKFSKEVYAAARGFLTDYLDANGMIAFLEISKVTWEALFALVENGFPCLLWCNKLEEINSVTGKLTEQVSIYSKQMAYSHIQEQQLRAKITVSSNKTLLNSCKIQLNTKKKLAIIMNKKVKILILPNLFNKNLAEIQLGSKSEHVSVAIVELIMKKLGRKVVYIAEAEYFFTQRMLAFILAEGLWFLKEGATIDQVDSAFLRVGFAQGIFSLHDSLDSMLEDIEKMHIEQYNNFEIPLETIGILSKFKRETPESTGFYTYKNKEKYKINEEIYNLFALGENRKFFRFNYIADIILALIANQTASCLSEGLFISQEEAEIACLFGVGYPLTLGGPFRYAKNHGKKKILENLKTLAQKRGKRFEPSPFWENI